jgi:hypothetical protein
VEQRHGYAHGVRLSIPKQEQFGSLIAGICTSIDFPVS